ncbi:MAG: hypothetical protein LBQ24_05655 [Candidatus Peribacteria bacterium]|nr:hypothetical protein [Candidatus Peribacteria bacterium]
MLRNFTCQLTFGTLLLLLCKFATVQLKVFKFVVNVLVVLSIPQTFSHKYFMFDCVSFHNSAVKGLQVLASSGSVQVLFSIA